MYEVQGKLLCAWCGKDYELLEIADKTQHCIVCSECWEKFDDNDEVED